MNEDLLIIMGIVMVVGIGGLVLARLWETPRNEKRKP